MAKPTASDIRTFLEGYEITSDILSDTWIEESRDTSVIPYIEQLTGMTFDGANNITEYLSGNGTDQLFLKSKNVSDLISLTYVAGVSDTPLSVSNIELIPNLGILKLKTNIYEGGTSALFGKGNNNIKVVYTVGESDYPDDIKTAIKNLVAEEILGFVGARTGGGSLGVQGHSRNYGDRGKYQDARNDFSRRAKTILRKYTTSVV